MNRYPAEPWEDVGIGIFSGQEITGIQFVASYSTVFNEDIGLSNGIMISIIIYAIEVLGAFIALFLIRAVDGWRIWRIVSAKLSASNKYPPA
ncbi:hypothetical protein V1520DRAFT_350546, partial [Lipomyces starkeyi]